MSVFGPYSRYYDLLNRDKDYDGEVEYVAGLLRRHSKRPVRSVLDVGCGTGSHDLLLGGRGFEVDGVDRSEDMIRVARARASGRNGLRFHVGDAANFRLGKKCDTAVSLFHVMSYQTSNEALEGSFATVREHLHEDGVFVFDFWYGPGVLTERPSVRVKRMEDEAIRVLRVATPVLDSSRNVVDVNYEVLVEDKETGHLDRFTETHSMRFLFKPELDYMLGRVGFRAVDFLEWMSTDGRPGVSTWNACVVAVK